MASKVYQSRSPQDPDDVLVSAELVEPAAVPAVVARARQAHTEWSALPAPARANALNRAAQRLEDAAAEVTDLGIREVGKPRTEMAAEVARGIAILRYYASRSSTLTAPLSRRPTVAPCSWPGAGLTVSPA